MLLSKSKNSGAWLAGWWLAKVTLRRLPWRSVSTPQCWVGVRVRVGVGVRVSVRFRVSVTWRSVSTPVVLVRVRVRVCFWVRVKVRVCVWVRVTWRSVNTPAVLKSIAGTPAEVICPPGQLGGGRRGG